MQTQKPVMKKNANGKQTLWLSTMMVLSLILIGYYTIGTPGTSVRTTSTSTSGTDSSGSSVGATGTSSGTGTDSSKANADNGYFATQVTKLTAEMVDESNRLTAIINSKSATPDEVSSARTQLSNLQTLMAKQQEMEDKIISIGYQDAIVAGDENRVNVTVQANSLDAKQALQIISVVEKELPSVSGNNITVGYHQ